MAVVVKQDILMERASIQFYLFLPLSEEVKPHLNYSVKCVNFSTQ